MIHLDSVEKAAQRIHTYLNDPEAFGEKLNANRRERLEALYSVMSKSTKMLGERLEKPIFESGDTETIIKAAATVSETAKETAQILRSILSSFQYTPTDAVLPIETPLDSTTTSASVAVGETTIDKPIPRNLCKRIYALFIQTLRVGEETHYSDPMLQEYTSFIWQHFTFRFAGGERYNIHQIQECITKMFVVFAHGYYSGDCHTFESQYTVWKRMY